MKFIIRSILISGLLFFGLTQIYAQTASILPPAKTIFVDANGKPLSGGSVYFYIPGTTTAKTTWQDAAETIPNSNPVVLDSSGGAIILGYGSYRQMIYDANNNLIWDQVTTSPLVGTQANATGDGDLVGTVKPWAGISAPSQYVFTYGQALSRTAYAALFNAIASTQAVTCTSGSQVIAGLADTTAFTTGTVVEISCVSGGSSTVTGKTSNSLTLAAASNVNASTTAVIFPWGDGDGSTTFNVPDFRGRTLAGNCIMGSTSCSNLSTTYYGVNPNGINAIGGSQSYTATSPSFVLTAANLPPHTHTSPTLTDPGHTHNFTAVLQQSIGNIQSGSAAAFYSTATTTSSSTTGITLSASTGTNSSGTSTAVNPGTFPVTTIQPTSTVNYIIKVTPDANSATASGVTALGGMTGSIACGTGTTCTGNTISATQSGVTSLNFSDYGSVSNGVADNSTAFNAFLTAICASPSRRGYLGAGAFNFTVQPNALPCPMVLFGAGFGATVILRSYNGTDGTGLISLVGTAANDSIIRDLGIYSGIGYTGGNAISIVSTTGHATSFVTLENIVMSTEDSSGNNFTNELYIDGSAATSAPNGVRDLSLKNVQIFGANGYSAVFKSVEGLSMDGGAVFPAGGSNANSGYVQVTGISGNVSNYVSLKPFNIAGVSLDYVNYVSLIMPELAGNISNTSNVTYVNCNIPYVGGTVQTNWTNSGGTGCGPTGLSPAIQGSAPIEILNGSNGQGMIMNCLQVAATYTGCPSAGVGNFGLGLQIAGSAPTNHFLCGNGTNYVDCGAAGSWTPTITTSGTIGSPTYSTQVGSYEQIGRQITARFTLVLSGWTGSPTGNVSLAGLPVTSANVTNDYGTCQISNYIVTGLAASNYGMAASIAPNSTTASLTSEGNTSTSSVTAAQFGTTGQIIGVCHYHS